MKVGNVKCLAAAALVSALLGAQSAKAQFETVTYFQGANTTTATNGPTFDGEVPVDAIPTHSGASDYSASGLNLGTAGYWFFNFDAPTNSGSAPEAYEVEALPSWVVVDKTSTDPTVRTLASDGGIDNSKGGQGYDTLTLPEASGPLTGESGALIAPLSAGDSVNVFQSMYLTAGTPKNFWLHIVLDNTNGAHDTDRRLKFRGHDEFGSEINMRLNNLVDIDGSPDVYSFLLQNWGAGDELAMQIRGFGGFNDRSIAGIMFDVAVPEPTSLALLSLGAVGLGCVRRRRR
ncbi:MAG: PEP-CTERM sorting domain-containing protein [Planctomycetales bacterium]|nr:PEP-CTERM sorting domain-containing protein [Planctomycetales bacterium]